MNKSTFYAYMDIQGLLIAVFLFIIAVAIKAMVPPAHSSTVDGDLIIVMTWPEWTDETNKIPTDMDLWVKDPEGSLVGFRNHFAGGLELGQDDTGMEDVHTTHRRFEKVVSRGLPAGEYIVNVHAYSKAMPTSVHVECQLKDIQTGLVSTVWSVDANFDHIGDERTIARFKLDASGAYLPDSFNTIPYPMIMR